jgi:hypothetical protein
MTFGKRDWVFIGIIVAVLAAFFAISGPEKTKKLPVDATHQQFNDMLKSGKKKSEVDPLCESCHDGVKIPFPANHPAKPGGAPMRCLFCHKSQK